jgi:site-specific DNA-methyltransferase (adenine-specific)
VWAARHTFNRDAVNGGDPSSQVFSVWRTPPSRREKLHGRHPTQKPLRLVRRALVACTREGDLVFDLFCGSGTTAVAAKELDRSSVGAEREEEYARLAGRGGPARVLRLCHRRRGWWGRFHGAKIGPRRSIHGISRG